MLTPDAREENAMAQNDGDMAAREWRALNWTTVAAVAVIAWITLPIGLGILMGTLIAFSLQPVYERLVQRLHPSKAALVTVSATALGLVALFGGLGWLFVARGEALSRQFVAELDARGGAAGAVERVAAYTSRFGVTSDDLHRQVRSVATAGADRTANVAREIGAATASSLLALFFAMLTMHFILRHWETIVRGAQQSLPLRPDYTEALLTQFRLVGRTTLIGTVLTGFAQGAIASVGYWICGVPEPVFFGGLTALASLIPAVGTLLVWVPVGASLILLAHVAAGVGVLVWSALLVVGATDYWIRPRLVRAEDEMPSLVTFAALFGGVETFGLKGLILGPVLMSLAVAVLRLYVKEAQSRRAETLDARAGGPKLSG
jgi:predicted PurR-regulated permease PerM